MKVTFMILLLSLLVLFGCSPTTSSNYDKDIDKIKNSDIYEAINLANSWREDKPDITSYATTKELIVSFPDGRIIKKALPKDTMYIAVAPYINNTHTCSTHYISSCKGELFNKTFKLTAKDENDNILIDNQIKTLDNGFFELWLPRKLTVKLNIRYNNLSVIQVVGTYNDSKTCITTA